CLRRDGQRRRRRVRGRAGRRASPAPDDRARVMRRAAAATASSLPARRWYLAILALSGFVTSFGAHIVATNLPAYAATAGVGAFTIGLLIGVYDFAELFAKPLAGLIADRRGMKPTLLVGLTIFVLGSLLFLAISPALLLVVRFIQGLGAAA